MDWIDIKRKKEFQIKDNQMVVVATFEKGMSVVISSFVGQWKEIRSVKSYELLYLYTHFMLVNNPKF